MKLATSLRVFALASLLTVAAAAANPVNTGALPGPANRIVGLWTTLGAVRPCGSELPFGPVRNTLLFQAGGTVVENPRFSPSGAPNLAGIPGIHQRGQALGTWSYYPTNRRYALHIRFDWYVDGLYHGFQTVDREILLSADGQQASGPVFSVRFSADGSVISQVCGEAVSDRL